MNTPKFRAQYTVDEWKEQTHLGSTLSYVVSGWKSVDMKYESNEVAIALCVMDDGGLTCLEQNCGNKTFGISVSNRSEKRVWNHLVHNQYPPYEETQQPMIGFFSPSLSNKKRFKMIREAESNGMPVAPVVQNNNCMAATIQDQEQTPSESTSESTSLFSLIAWRTGCTLNFPDPLAANFPMLQQARFVYDGLTNTV